MTRVPERKRNYDELGNWGDEWAERYETSDEEGDDCVDMDSQTSESSNPSVFSDFVEENDQYLDQEPPPIREEAVPKIFIDPKKILKWKSTPLPTLTKSLKKFVVEDTVVVHETSFYDRQLENALRGRVRFVETKKVETKKVAKKVEKGVGGKKRRRLRKNSEKAPQPPRPPTPLPDVIDVDSS